MIVVDASALLGVYLEEIDSVELRDTLVGADEILISPVNLWEVLVRAERLNGQVGRVQAETLVADFGIQIVEIDRVQAMLAVDAFAKFGRGTKANLNLGDCFAYALAQSRGVPLLFKGDDFQHTDILRA